MNSENSSKPSSDGKGAVRSPPAIPNFVLLRPIGIGAYGEVWLARDIMGDYVAMKVVYRDRFTDDRPYHREYEGIRRFRRVSRTHPSQLTVLHVGQGQGFFYYAMELADDANASAARAQAGVEGDSGTDSTSRTEHRFDSERYSPRTLRSLLRADGEAPGHGGSPRCALSVEQCLEIGIALASALECLHGARLVHRDIKPSNIVFVPDAGSVRALAMTPDGSRLAVALTERLLVLDGVTGVSLGELPTSATALAFSPDGAQLAVGESEGFTRVYRVPSRAPLAELPAPEAGNRIACLAFGRNPVVRREPARTANPWLLATGDRGGGIVIWDLDQQLPKCFCRGSTWTVSALTFDPDGLTLTSAGRNEPRLWDVTTGELLLLLESVGAGNARTLAFDGTGRRMLCGGEWGASYSEKPRVILWELEPHRGIETLRGLSSAARRVWFSANSQRVAALSDDWHLAVWDLARHRLLFVFETPNGVFADQAGGCFDPSGERFAFATWNEARVYDLETGATASQWTLPKGLGDQLEYDTDGRLLLLRREQPAEVDGEKARVWRLYELGKPPEPVRLRQQTETNWWAEGLLFQPGGKRFAVWNGGDDGTNRTGRMFEVNHGREVWKRETAFNKGELRMCFDPGGNWFGYKDAPDRQRLIRIEGLEEMGFSKQGFEAIGPSGKNFAGCRKPDPKPAGGGMPENESHRRREASFLWLYFEGAAPFPLVAEGSHLAWVSAFSPDGRLLAWGTEEGVVHVAHIAEVAKRLAELNPRGAPSRQAASRVVGALKPIGLETARGVTRFSIFVGAAKP